VTRDPHLLFGAIKELSELLDEQCEDPGLTTFILAIDALAQRGFEETWRREHGLPVATVVD
jgi:hypothetical protein